MGVDGVVIGFLNGDRVDIELTHRVLARAPELRERHFIMRLRMLEIS